MSLFGVRMYTYTICVCVRKTDSHLVDTYAPYTLTYLYIYIYMHAYMLLWNMYVCNRFHQIAGSLTPHHKSAPF